MRRLRTTYLAGQRGVSGDALVSGLAGLDEHDIRFLCQSGLQAIGKGDSKAVRARTLVHLGDSLKTANRGPIGLYNELAIATYRSAIDLDPQSREIQLKIAAAWGASLSGDSVENARQAELHLNQFLASVGQSEHELRGIAFNLRGFARSINPTQTNAARRDFQGALVEFEMARVPNFRVRRAGVLINLAKLEADYGGYSLAERYYREALSLYTYEDVSSDIALAQRDLAATLLDWAKSIMETDRIGYSARVEESVLLLNAAYAATDKRVSPRAAAIIELNLAMAYALRIDPSGTKFLAIAREKYQYSAQRFHQLLDPINERRALVGEGGIAFELSDWRGAAKSFRDAVFLLDEEWLHARSVASRVRLVRDYSDVYGFGVLSAIKADDPLGALQMLEHGRSRLLREALYSGYLLAPAGVQRSLWRSLQRARQKKADLGLGMTPSDMDAVVVEKGTTIERQKRDEEQIIRSIRAQNPTFIPVAQPESPEALCDLGKELNAELWVAKPTRKGTVLLVVTAAGELRTHIVSVLTHEKLALIMNKWIANYEEFRQCRDERARFFWWTEWRQSLKPVLDELGCLVISKFLRLGEIRSNSPNSISEGPNQRKRIYILASGILDLIPWHAISVGTGETEQHLIDIADVGYFNSGTLLRASAHRQKMTGNSEHLLMFRDRQVCYGDWLVECATEVYAGASHTQDLPASETLLKRTIERSKNDAVAIFSCHAKAHAQDPLKSGLYNSFAKQPCISLGDLLGISTIGCKLVVLNACESSLAEIGDPADECLSLANAFLATGSAAVVGTQWCAGALSAALWCGRFLELLRQGLHDPLRAACLSSIWLRDSTFETITKFLERFQSKAMIEPTTIRQLDGSDVSNWANHKYYGASFQSRERQPRDRHTIRQL